ncbi:MAG: family 20 glycosylhydrolase [Candidatus Marinimicrobia bacterium]|nr:family 20 glycosylhydrolase [Candidatus Neomarinimicrobiota bacterium]
MKNGSRRVYQFLMATFLLYPTISTADINLIPQPNQLDIGTGYFILNEHSKIAVTPETEQIGLYLAQIITKHTGWELAILPLTNRAEPNLIILSVDSLTDNDAEGYHLDIDEKQILLSAASPAGVFYGCQTLRQLLPKNPQELQRVKQSGTWQIPSLRISDFPRFAWRGMMLDVSRHFFPLQFIKELIDYLSYHKLNTFHWHLVDDQGWRIEIKRYPKLTEIGAWRVDRPDEIWGMRKPQQPDESATYGGYYTQEDIREIVQYARERFITIVPEIEMPAHVTCALAAYPQLSCTGGPFTVPTGSIWPIKDIYCAGREETFEFLENVLTEVIDLFPGEYIHIGGDEAHKGEWKQCDSCQTRIAVEGLQDEAELQSYFIGRIEKFLTKHNRKLIGWDEILEGGLAPEATVMSWRGTKGGIAAAQAGHYTVMSPVSHCYLNCYQGNLALEPLAQSGYLPLSKVYSFNPVPKRLTAQQSKFILGAQANLWAEFIPDPKHAEYMLFPRLSALSEILWSSRQNQDWDSFRTRLTNFFSFYDFYNINYSTSARQVRLHAKPRRFSKTIKISMDTELPGLDIRYTTDGSTPTPQSQLYTKPLRIKETVAIKSATFENENVVSPISELAFQEHLALKRKVTTEFQYHWRYRAGGKDALTDGIRASDHYRDQYWQGYRKVDFNVVVDLGRSRRISSISAGYLQDVKVGIFMPREIEYSISRDGITYQVIGLPAIDMAVEQPGPIKKDIEVSFAPIRARYIRVKAINIGSCPDWHYGAGKDAYIFVDEIVVN